MESARRRVWLVQAFKARVFILYMYLAFFSTTEASCVGTYSGDCLVELSCFEGDRFNLADIIFKTKDRLVTCHRFESIQNFNNVWNSLDYIVTYKHHSNFKFKGSVPQISDFPDSSIIELNVGSNNYDVTPSFYRMDKLRTLNLSNNYITQAKIFNEELLESLKIIDYSHNIINEIYYEEHFGIYVGLTHLNLSFNNFRDKHRGKFRLLENLEYLDLSFNNIRTLEFMAFEGLANLQKLHLTGNQIEDLSLALEGLDSLQELYLDNNKLKILKVQDFQHLSNLKMLFLSSNSIVTIENDVFNHLPYLEEINLRNNSLATLPRDFESLNNLNSIDLSFNNIHVLLKNIFKGKNISSFYIEGNQISGAISKGCFEGITFETKLDLSRQNITEVCDYTFYKLENLISLNLSHNSIYKLTKNSFKTLRSLVELDLSNNRIVLIDFDKLDLISLEYLNLANNLIQQLNVNDFSHLSMLKHLSLSHNSIAHIEECVFESNNELFSLKISDNPLVGDINARTFKGLVSLVQLDISNTLFKIGRNGSFEHMESLQHLNISHSNLSEIEFDIFSDVRNLKSIDLSFNKIKIFNINGSHLFNLQELILNNNFLGSISRRDFDGFSHLSELTMSQNRITKIESEAFDSLKKLRYLDLSYNNELNFDGSVVQNNLNLEVLTLSGTKNFTEYSKMVRLPLNQLELSFCEITDLRYHQLNKLKHLNFLDLSKNNISAINAGTFDNLTDLRFLDLSFNKISYIQPGSFKLNMYLNFLNISHNYLTTIQYGCFRGLDYVFTIDLSYNQLKFLKSEMFTEATSLKNLIVDGNKLIKLDITNVNTLELLSLGDNPLKCDDISKLKDSFESTVHSLNITALKLDLHSENVIDGVTCHNMFDDEADNTIATNQYERNEFAPSVLVDIRSILLKMSEGAASSKLSNKDSNLNTQNSLIDLTRNFNISMLDKLAEFDKIINVATNTINITNVLLRRLIDTTLTAQKPIQTALDLPKSTDTNSTIDIVNYVNSIRKELELNNILKENRLADLEDKINQMSKIVSRSDQQSQNTETNKEKFVVEKEKQSTDHGRSTFTEICVALILIILVAAVLYKLYRAGFSVRSWRSPSTRQITESIESANF